MKIFTKETKINDKKIILFTGFFSVVLASIYSYIKLYRYLNIKSCLVPIAMLFIVTIIVFLNLKKANSTFIMIVTLFFLMALYWRAFPLANGPDDPDHFYRAYEIANVNAVAVKNINNDNKGSGDYLPVSLKYFNDKTATITTETEPYLIRTLALYNPVSYLPQVIGIKIGQLFTNNVYKIYCAGTFSVMAFAFILCSLALCILPFGKKVCFLIMTFPMSLEMMSSLSSDGFVIPLCIFFTSYILFLRYTKKKIELIDIALLAVLCNLVSLSKIVYIVMLLLLLMIPNTMYKNKHYAYISKTLTILTSIVLNLVWLKIASEHLVEFCPGVNSAEQVSFVLNNIVTYIKTIFYSINELCLYWVNTMFGSQLGRLSIRINPVAIALLIITLIYTIAIEKCSYKEVNKKDMIIEITTFIVGFLLILTSLYVQWNSVGNNVIVGVQGRYFIPLFPLLCLLVIELKTKIANKINIERTAVFNNHEAVILIVVFYNFIAITDVLLYFQTI